MPDARRELVELLTMPDMENCGGVAFSLNQMRQVASLCAKVADVAYAIPGAGDEIRDCLREAEGR